MSCPLDLIGLSRRLSEAQCLYRRTMNSGVEPQQVTLLGSQASAIIRHIFAKRHLLLRYLTQENKILSWLREPLCQNLRTGEVPVLIKTS